MIDYDAINRCSCFLQAITVTCLRQIWRKIMPLSVKPQARFIISQNIFDSIKIIALPHTRPFPMWNYFYYYLRATVLLLAKITPPPSSLGTSLKYFCHNLTLLSMKWLYGWCLCSLTGKFFIRFFICYFPSLCISLIPLIVVVDDVVAVEFSLRHLQTKMKMKLRRWRKRQSKKNVSD